MNDAYMAALDAAIAAEGNTAPTPEELSHERQANMIQKHGTSEERRIEKERVAHLNRVMLARNEFDTRDYWNETPAEAAEAEAVVAEAEAVIEAEAQALDLTVAELEQRQRNESAIARRVADLEVDQEARRRVAAKNYDGLGRLLSWADLEHMGALNYLVPGWIPMGDISFLVAKRNLGKSMFAFALGFSVALGLPFLDQPTTQGKVVFVLGEGSRGFMKRLKAWALANGVNPDDLRDRVAVYKGGKINNDQSLADMQRVIDNLDPVLVVFDTYSSLSGVVNEIDGAENAEVLNRIRRAAPEAAKLILAHPNAETESTSAPRLRGSSVLSSNVDTVITMFRDKGRVVPGMPFGDWLAISTAEPHAGKQKDDSNKTLHGFAVLANSEGAFLSYHSTTALSKADAWVSGNLVVGDMVTVNGLVASTGVSKRTIWNHLKESTMVSTHPSTSGGETQFRRDR